MDDGVFDDDLDALFDSTLNETFERIDSAEYGGVLGKLPKWVPEYRAQAFCQARSRLAEYEDSQITQWMDDSDINAANECEYVRRICIPIEVITDISLLALIRKAVLSGEAKGMPMLVGEIEAKNIDIAQRVSNGHTKREDHIHKTEFQELVKKHKGEFSNLKELKQFNEFNFFVKWYGKGHTLRDWVNEALPGHLKRGAPKKNK